MKDTYGRSIEYLRISLTDRCNLRCQYCMGEEGVEKLRHEDILSLEEVAEIAQAAVSLGVRKLRLTGGEPLLRRGVVELCRTLRALPGLEELCITTNGTLLPSLAAPLREAGVDRLNISLDTLREERYRRITRVGTLSDALRGIEAARSAGFTPLKINTVLMGGVNDDELGELIALTKEQEIELRFIELMPMGEKSALPPEAYLPCSVIPQRFPALEPLGERRGVAELYRLPGARGTVGLIRPVSCAFCESCDRLRLTADGYLKPCLHSAQELSVRHLHGEALRERLREAVAAKPACHGVLSAERRSGAARDMNKIGG